MVAVAIFSIDPILRRNLEQLPHDDPAFALVEDHPSSVPELLNQHRIDVLLATPRRESCWRNIEAGHDRQTGDRRAQRAKGNRRGIGDKGQAGGGERREAEADQDRARYCNRRAEARGALEEGAEREGDGQAVADDPW